MKKSEKFEKLFESGRIAHVLLKNRAVSAPTGTGYSTRDGMVTDRLIRFYKDKAKGGIGLIIVEYAYVDLKGSQSVYNQLGAYDDNCVMGLSRLAEVIQHHGAKACLQIMHAGRQRTIGTYPMVAPSRIPLEESLAKGGVIPNELSIEEIKGIIEAFGDAARRTKQAGFDMVEIHGAHGYLITNFLSSSSNRRKDMYGGDLNNRMRFGIEILQNVRTKVGWNYPVGFRLNGSQYMDGGITIEEAIALSKELEEIGVDFLHISAGNRHTLHTQVVPSYLPRLFNIGLAQRIKDEVKVPVIGSGSIATPELANEVLREGKADFVSFARPTLADPYLMKKAKEGRTEDIRPCIRCNEGCITKRYLKGVMCSVNIALGREEDFGRLQYEEGDPAPQPRKVVVIGGGPAGMEAARVAALRGHEVILFEKRDRLGGALIEASIPEFKKDLRPLIDYLSGQMSKLKVKVTLGSEVTVQKVLTEKPEAVILATGGTAFVPPVPGTSRPIVSMGLDVLRGKEVGDEVVIIGGNMGGELGWYLLDQKPRRSVSIVTMEEIIASNIDFVHQAVLMENLTRSGAKIYAKLTLLEVLEDGVVIKRTWKGSEQQIKIPGDSVVMMSGFRPSQDLAESLRQKGLRLFLAGDCINPRGIQEAIYEGHVTARAIV